MTRRSCRTRYTPSIVQSSRLIPAQCGPLGSKRRESGGSWSADGDPVRADALRQPLFREINNQIEGLSSDWAPELRDVALCECSNLDCLEPIEIDAAEYRAVRRFPTRFLIKHGHLAENDRVVHESAQYLVVETIGRAAEDGHHPPRSAQNSAAHEGDEPW